MKNKNKRDQLFGFLAWQLASFVAAAIGGLASVNAKGFYSGLAQPEWAPPGSVFGPVWTTLFVLMGISAWLVWRQSGFRGSRLALGLYVVQLAVNALWSWLFFVWQMGAAALLDVAVLWVLIAACMVLFWRVSKIAALLLTPYLAWVSFAAVLNYTLWQMNPVVLG